MGLSEAMLCAMVLVPQAAVLDYDNFGQITAMLEQAAERLGLYQFVNFINPIRHEAMKTYA